MGSGKLWVQTTAGGGILPISGARVRIWDNGELLYDMITDGSGNSDTVSIEAPDKSLALDPDYSGWAYSVVDVEADAPGYGRKIIDGVKIYDTVTTILPVDLLPEAGVTGNSSETVLPPGPLDTAEEYDQQGPTAAPYVLKDVIIPDKVIVHMGPPTVQAVNRWVPYKDYIKNVASREIRPIWDNAALEANILAQISFTLNRIYTEWYTGQGYSFNITNSTLTDQSYNPDEGIFQNISQIVDRLFNQYIRRQGSKEPFFAQYCKNTCAGLSQEGSQKLAEKGYSAIEILKAYYPKDIEIVSSNNFGELLSSYPGTVLKRGTQGPAVTMIQEQLGRIHGDYPKINLITDPPGYFGSSTESAVKVFQKDVGKITPVDGIVGRNTWYSINGIYVGVKKLADLSSEGERLGIGTVPPSSIIKLKAKGRDVVELQHILKMIASFYPEIPDVVGTGVFDTQTEQAVKAFQYKFGLNQDGVVGPGTWRKLYDIYWAVQITIPPGGGGETPSYPGVLKVGSRGESVKILQQYLNVLNEVYPEIPRVQEDGIFGAGTEVAVKAFQNLFGLNADGIVGPLTWERLVQEANWILSGGGTGTPVPVYPGTLLRLGSRGADVRLMQQYLNALSAIYPSIPPLNPDGVFGNATYNAVVAFQQLFNLKADGIIGKATWDKVAEEFHKLGGVPNLPAYPGTSLKVGSRGNDVILMQQYLNALSAVYPTILPLKADGIFGEGTKSSVIAFQRLFSLTPDGIIGRMTWEKIIEEYNELFYRRGSNHLFYDLELQKFNAKLGK